MNNFPLISVIIPVYNVEKYLHQCMDSVLAQTYKNLEVILVDDGSMDGSAKLCDEYAAKDPRVKVIHQTNLGVSAARNAGLKAARGEYIGFVDGDDYIDPDMFACLFELCHTCHTEIAVCGVHNKAITVKFDREVLSSHQALVRFAAHLYVWNKLFSRRVIKNITFYTDFHFCEDLFFCLETFQNTDRIACTPQRKYYYRVNPNSATKQAFNLQKLTYFQAAEAAKAFARAHRIIGFEKCIRLEEAATAASFLAALISFDHPNKEQINAELLSNVRRNIWFLLGSRGRWGNKFFALMCCVNFKLACRIYQVLKGKTK